MAEEKQEDMSMDEILSSIKNILSENGEPVADASASAEPATQDTVSSDNVNPPADSETLDLPAEDIAVNDLPFSAEDDNILDLTSDMRADPSPATATENTPTVEADAEIDIDSELANVPEVDAGDVPATVAAPEPAPTASTEADTDIDSLLPEVNVISDDTDSDPIYTPEDEASSQPLYKGNDELLSDTPEISTQADNFNVEEIALDSDTLPDTKTDIKNGPQAESNSDAVDVSASIINNFAKIFADNKAEAVPAQPTKVSPSVKLGADATLSDMVKATIRDMLSEQIINTLAQDADIKSLLSSEVSAQVKQWLDKNLPSMVESIVKKEIERVMVKAGRN